MADKGLTRNTAQIRRKFDVNTASGRQEPDFAPPEAPACAMTLPTHTGPKVSAELLDRCLAAAQAAKA
jgi:hypothetical protein